MSFGFAYWRLKQAEQTGTDPVTNKTYEEVYGTDAVRPNPNDPMQDVFENKNLLFQLALIKLADNLSKRPGGMKALSDIGKETVKGLFNTMDSLGQASAANHVAAWANPVLISGVLERFGLLPPHFNTGYHAGVTTISGVNLALDVVETIFSKGGAFPTTLSFAKK